MLITKPAVKIEQDGRVLFLTQFTVDDFRLPGFFKVEELKAGADIGYQRKLDERRAKWFARDIQDGYENDYAFLPTSIFLATDKQIAFNADRREIAFESGEVCPFYMVDGQHRVHGLQMAARENEALRDFLLATVISTGLDEMDQTIQFLVVNSTQKKVNAALEQQIRARFTDKDGLERLPYLPDRVRREVERRVDQKALELITYLNKSEYSPWRGKIQMANQSKSTETTVGQNAVVTSLKKFAFIRGHPLALENNTEARCRMLENYWQAIVSVILPDYDGEEKSALFTGTGTQLFHGASMALFGRARNFSKAAFQDVLREAFGSIADEFAEVQLQGWWRKGGVASTMNSAAIGKCADAISAAVELAAAEDDGEIKL